jgi:hypothetical protein
MVEIVVCPFTPFLLIIVLFVLLPYTHTDDPFDILKLFIYEIDCDTCNSYKWINSELLFNERTPSSGKVKYHDTHLILYIMTDVLCCIIYDTCLTLKMHIYLSHNHMLWYILYDTCFMLYIYDSYLLVLRSTHSAY